jgi:hypothetical protein
MHTDPHADPAKLEAALEQLEQERRRRQNEKVERGEAVRVPPIVVSEPGDVAGEKARRLAELRAAGEAREVIFGHESDDGSEISVIITGVPRSPNSIHTRRGSLATGQCGTSRCPRSPLLSTSKRRENNWHDGLIEDPCACPRRSRSSAPGICIRTLQTSNDFHGGDHD